MSNLNEKENQNLYVNSSLDSTSTKNASVAIPIPTTNDEKNAQEIDPYERFNEREKSILKKQIETPPVTVSYFKLFKYATKREVFLYIIAAIAAIIEGVALPLMTVFFGSISNKFATFFINREDPEGFQRDVNHMASYFVYIGCALLGGATVTTFLTVYLGELLTNRIRVAYLKAILRQNMGFFDDLGSGEITTRIVTDTNSIQSAISEKVSVIISALASLVTAFVIAYVRAWKLAFILLSVFVSIMATFLVATTFIVKYNQRSNEKYAAAGSVAEEAISTIRNVQSFSISERISNKFKEIIDQGKILDIKGGLAVACMVASLWGIMFFSYALGFWQGSRYIASAYLSISQVITTLMAMIFGSFIIGQNAIHMRAIAAGTAAAKKIFSTIERESPIDPLSEKGDIIENVKGEISFRGIKFVYPSRLSVTVLENFNLDIPSGSTVALVGMSGSGKSTVVGLLERFYQPLDGEIFLDGVDISTLNLRWLRQQIAIVSQEPTLFSCSIYDNIAYGLIGTQYEDSSREIQSEMVYNAARQANAYDFINALPEGFETNVGERGFLLSGGQKQRVAIARAIVSNPKILLLDEATSALDTKSEEVVQDALDRASQSRTTIVIAHRLSTIRDADVIVVMSKGKILEKGTHNELMDKQGAYFQLVSAQTIRGNEGNQHRRLHHHNESHDSNNQLSHTLSGTTGMDIEMIRTKSFTESIRSNLENGNKIDLEKSLTNHSVSSKVLRNNSSEPITKKYSFFTLFMTLLKINKPEYGYIIIAFVAALFSGGLYPVNAVFFAKVILAFAYGETDPNYMRSQVNLWSGLFFMLGCVGFISQGILISLLTIAGERLVARIRTRCFDSILSQDIEFFDRPTNSTGTLTSSISKEGEDIKGLSGATLAHFFQSAVTLFGGVILAIVIGWKLGLVCTATVPVLVGSGFMRLHVIGKISEYSENANRKSSGEACEATTAIRTVASLTREDEVVKSFESTLDKQLKSSLFANSKSALLFGFSVSCPLFITGLGFWYGGTLMRRGEYSIQQFFICFIAVIFGAQTAGQVFSYAPDVSKATEATAKVKRLLESKPVINVEQPDSIKLDHVEGNLNFDNVHFRYPTRPEVPVLRGLNLTIKKGEYVALVGSSGCGKSTTISLIESFYRPLSGLVTLDGYDISKLDIEDYRKHIAFVQQEPVLYSGTIRENILYGSQTPESVSEDDIYNVAREANIHNFIMSLPEGYETKCGSKGVMLSGGQKQRIAIARALIRNPKILLLDEATSALDSESEKIVQEALDKAAQGRTTIAVAHRLSTIQNADIIYVFEEGKICESGKHEELLAKKGRYFELVKLQNLEKTT